MRTILHIDMDAFFASVEQRDHPEYRGKPVIVGSPPDQRGVVATCSYEARAFGVHSAMPSREAYRLCPHGIFLVPDMKRYREASLRIFEIFNRFTPFVEGVSVDEAFLDVTGSQTLFGDGKTIGEALRKTIRKEVGLPASVGVAVNKFLAKLASEHAKPNGIFCVPVDKAGQLRFLASLSVSDLWGVGKTTANALRAAGIKTVADIQKSSPTRLRQLLGENMANHLFALAFGRDERPVVTSREEKSISNEFTFLEDVSDRETIHETLKHLAEKVAGRVRAHGLYACTGHLKLRWKDFTTITRQRPFQSPSCDDFSFRNMAFELFDAEPMKQAVRLVGFGVSKLQTERIEQLSLFGDENTLRDKHERLSRALDELRAKKHDKS